MVSLDATGKGQCIGIIELGGGFKQADITNYFQGLGLSVPTVKAISVDGAKNSPSTPDGADGEVMLDIEVAGAVANGSSIAVYFAPNTDQGFLDAITQAVHDTVNKPSVISISWGSAELIGPHRPWIIIMKLSKQQQHWVLAFVWPAETAVPVMEQQMGKCM